MALTAFCGMAQGKTQADQNKLQTASKGMWLWSADADGMVSGETGGPSTGYLWSGDGRMKALIFAFQNMNEETLFASQDFRDAMAKNGVGILWIAPGFGQEWDIMQGVQEAFDGLLDKLAAASGHSELTEIPLIPFGHSAQATMPWNFTAWNPDRTLCLISYHGDSPRTNLCGFGRSNIEWGRNRNIDGIPALMVMGEYEWWDARLRPGMGFRIWYPESCVSFLGDAGRGHFDLGKDTERYLIRFIEKSLDNRLKEGKLVKIDPKQGWLAPIPDWSEINTTTDIAQAAAWDEYKGNPYESFWFFDREMAEWATRRYAETRGKKGSWLNLQTPDGKLASYNPNAHCKVLMEVTPDKDDIFELKAVFTDSLRCQKVKDPDRRKAVVHYVSGPAIEIAPGKFKVDRSHPTWNNPRRRGKITVAAEAPHSATHKAAVQEAEISVL